ncbi:MAG: NlpC/P60 family protein [Ruminococcaceae bacterium]|nr:NlpC/P60 family protein [Oscillospiraceae bacterium]
MKSKLVKAAVLCAVVAALLVTPALAATIGGATVNGSNVRLRSAADTSTGTNIITELQSGTFLLVEEKVGNWYKVVYNGVPGYISASYISFSESLNGAYGFTAETAGTSVNLRAAASTASGVVKNIAAAGTKLNVLGVSGQWLRVSDASGVSGYIRSDLVKYKAASAPQQTQPVQPSAPATAGDKLVETAMLYKGYAYTWGGMSPSTGFDCSGFANYVCKQHDITLNRVAQDIYSYDGTAVAKENLLPGDLVFFGYGPYCVTHMGIYIGDNDFIHASTSTTGVIISELDSNYYTRMYVGAKRVA